MVASATSMDFCPETRQLFVGLENGSIYVCSIYVYSVFILCWENKIINICLLQEFIMESDYNRMTSMREYIAHQGRVTGVIFSLTSEWILSIGRDKYFQYHSTETGQKIGMFQTEAWYTALQYPFLKFLNFIYLFYKNFDIFKLHI